MKVIFLDIDGVLNSVDYMNALHYRFRSEVAKGEASFPVPMGETSDEFGQYFDDRCIIHLEAILNYTGAKLVISSTWRKNGLKWMRSLWEYRCLEGDIIDVTPVVNLDRGEEIQLWLDENQVDNYVVIDDETFDIAQYHPNNFVKTNGRFGLTLVDAKKAVEILNK